MKQTTFEIRAYGVGELAELYSPHMSHRGAIMQLWRWINYHGVLKAKLLELGFRPGIRTSCSRFLSERNPSFR